MSSFYREETHQKTETIWAQESHRMAHANEPKRSGQVISGVLGLEAGYSQEKQKLDLDSSS